ncbi:MAG: adenylate kinase [Bacteroidetes bacterium]|nr:adenylate kinase [Bacteroidota bacterium]MDA1119096.1 adenylate kinase [Bacteroidota bacterium]
MLNIVLFGPPGAGKGTQSEKIIAKYRLTHISTGDLFRNHLGEGTALGLEAKKYMNEGKLVPDALVIDMVEVKIRETRDAYGFIFDGFPRTVEQAKALDKVMRKFNYEISGMVALEVPEKELKKRIKLRALTSGRVDDQDDEKINTRIRVYEEETLPVAKYYQQQGKYQGVSGIGSIDNIFKEIARVIDLI